MRFLLLLLVVVHVGCSSSPEFQDAQAELENVGDCFVASTIVLQREPDNPQNLSQFLFDGKAASNNSDTKGDQVDFASLNLEDEGATIKTASGKPIVCRIVKQEHDNYGAGTAFITTYEFFVPDTKHLATRSVDMRID